MNVYTILHQSLKQQHLQVVQFKSKICASALFASTKSIPQFDRLKFNMKKTFLIGSFSPDCVGFA